MSGGNSLTAVFPTKRDSYASAILFSWRDVGAFFQVTTYDVVLADGTLVSGTPEMAVPKMKAYIDAHIDGTFALVPECLYRDPDDQRPANEPRVRAGAPETGTSLPTQRPPQNEGQKPTETKYTDRQVGVTQDRDAKPIYSFKLAQVRLEANQNGSRYLALYPLISGGPGKYPAVRVNDHKSQVINWGIISSVTGVLWGDAAVSTMYAANGIDCLYTLSDKQTQQGNPYKDFYQLAEATEEAAEEMPF